MTDRNFVFGLGLGMIFSVLFMFVFPTPASVPTDLSTEQVQEWAQAKKLVVLPKEEYDKLMKQTEKHQKQPAVVPTPPKAPAQTTPQPPVATKPTTPPSVTPTPQQPPATKVEVVTVIVPYASTAASVAQTLVKVGLLPPNNNFVVTLRDLNKLNRIQVGTYQIPMGTSVEQIIAMITTPPKL